MNEIRQSHNGIEILAEKIPSGWCYSFTVPLGVIFRGPKKESRHAFTADRLSPDCFDLAKTTIDYITGEFVTFDEAAQGEARRLVTLRKGEPHEFQQS